MTVMGRGKEVNQESNFTLVDFYVARLGLQFPNFSLPTTQLCIISFKNSSPSHNMPSAVAAKFVRDTTDVWVITCSNTMSGLR
jgi:hypothetical protein